MKIALLFPGYGSQYVGMGKDLYDEYRIVQEYFEEASNCLNVNFVKLCFASSDAELSKLSNAYAALFLMGSAVYAVLKEHGIEPDVVAGYNNGEYTALFAASCFNFPDGLYLLNKFCLFYQEIIEGMDVDLLHITAVTTHRVEDACEQVSNSGGKAYIALYNSPTDHIVVANPDKLSHISDIIDGDGAVNYIGTEAGLHCELMNAVIEQFKMYLEKVDFKDLHIPLISCIDGNIVTEGIDARDRFVRYINSPVMFNAVMGRLDEYDCIVVATPGDALYKIIKEQYPDKFVISIAKKEDIDTLKEMVKKEYEEIGFIDGN